MSWDISIMDLPDVEKIDEIPKNFKPKPLGKRADLIKKIKDILPETDFSDPSWGSYVEEDMVIEFNMGRNDICESIGLRVRGSDMALLIIDKIIKHLSLKAFDVQEGEIFSIERARKSFKRWNDWKGSMVK